MCFLSVYKLKYLISIGIVVTLLIGVALLYVLVYSFIISSVTIQVQSDFRTILIVLFLSTSLLMILSSLSGIYGNPSPTQASSGKRTNSLSSTLLPWESTCSLFWCWALAPQSPQNTSPNSARTSRAAPTNRLPKRARLSSASRTACAITPILRATRRSN